MRVLALRQRAGLGLVLLASLGLGAARAFAVPPGYNVDEWARLPSAIRQAWCWREMIAEAAWPAECWAAGHYRGNPIYYLLLSAPITFIPDDAPAAQYYAARLVTAGLGLIALWLAWLACRELLGSGRTQHRLGLIAVAIPAAVALNQSFGDIMSGVNSDASAVVALALLTYGMARLEARRGRPGQPGRERAGSWALLALGILACWYSTSSARWLGVPVLAWWAVSQIGPRFRLALLAAAAAGGLGLLVIPNRYVEWQSPQYWFNAGPTEILGPSTRVETEGPLGPHALLAQAGAENRATDDEVQYLPDRTAAALAGKTITFGAWLRAPQGETVQGPLWDDGTQRTGPTVTASGDWQWVAGTAVVAPAASAGGIVLAPPPSGAAVLYDGLTLAEGEYPTGEPPSFANAAGQSGEWGGRAFANLLLNPSLEATWPELRPSPVMRDIISYNGRLRSFLAWRRTAAAFPAIFSWLFAGFWSAFSGLHPGLTRLELLPLALFTLAGAAGAFLTAVSGRARPELRRAVRFFAPIALIIWLEVILRADLWPNLPQVLSFAGARYALTAMIPTTALLVIGGLYWLPPKAQPKALAVLCLALWLVCLHVLLREQMPFYDCLLGGNGTGNCLGR